MKLSDIKRARQAVERGGWVSDIEITGLEGLKLQVRGFGNSDYNKLYADLASELPPDKRDADGAPVPAERESIMVECLKRTILIGWSGIEDEFTPAAVDEAFADPDLGPAFRAAVMYAATMIARNARSEQGIAEKN